MRVGQLDRAATTDAPTCILRMRCVRSPVRRLNGSASFDIDIENWGRVKAFPRAVAVVDEREKERDRYTPWLHREVQGRVAGPVVQLRFISLFPWSSADQRQ